MKWTFHNADNGNKEADHDLLVIQKALEAMRREMSQQQRPVGRVKKPQPEALRHQQEQFPAGLKWRS